MSSRCTTNKCAVDFVSLSVFGSVCPAGGSAAGLHACRVLRRGDHELLRRWGLLWRCAHQGNYCTQYDVTNCSSACPSRYIQGTWCLSTYLSFVSSTIRHDHVRKRHLTRKNQTTASCQASDWIKRQFLVEILLLPHTGMFFVFFLLDRDRHDTGGSTFGRQWKETPPTKTRQSDSPRRRCPNAYNMSFFIKLYRSGFIAESLTGRPGIVSTNNKSPLKKIDPSENCRTPKLRAPNALLFQQTGGTLS